MEKGYVIVIEGTDGSGKQTQAQLLKDRLNAITNNNVFECSFPNYDSPSSAPVKMYLGGELGKHGVDVNAYQASVIYATDRLCTYLKTIKEHYEQGKIIVLDRYTTSNALHQASTLDDLSDKDKFLDWLFDLEYRILGLPEPDKVIFLNVPPAVSQKLREERTKTQGYKTGNSKDILEDDKDHIQKAYTSGMYVAKKCGWELVPCVNKDNNLKPRDEISNAVFDTLCKDEKFMNIIKG